MKRWTKHLVLSATFPLLAFLTAMAFAAVTLPTVAVAAEKQEDLKDSDITLAVQSELIFQDAVPSQKIDVTTSEGIVTLSGSVDNYYSKLEAAAAAEEVKGVRAVINNITVTPLSRLDFQIHADIISALAIDPVTESYQVDVNVDKGVVTLKGKVDSYTEKMVAEEVAQDVKGVVDVKNLLTYDIIGDRSNSDIREDIKYRLKSDATIDAGLITVKVNDGKVTLEGSVASAAEKSRATTDSWIVPGVTSVDNKLDVNWWVDSDTTDWTAGWTDVNRQQAIKRALLMNPRVKSFNVFTTVHNGVATLTGMVDNLEAKRAAESEALHILGVWRVKNYLRVRPAADRSDREIAEDVRDALKRNPYVDRYEIAVTAYNGKVVLTGEVDSFDGESDREGYRWCTWSLRYSRQSGCELQAYGQDGSGNQGRYRRSIVVESICRQ